MEELPSTCTDTAKEILAAKRGEKMFFRDNAAMLWVEQGCTVGWQNLVGDAAAAPGAAQEQDGAQDLNVPVGCECRTEPSRATAYTQKSDNSLKARSLLLFILSSTPLKCRFT